MDSSSILNTISGSITLFIILYEFLGSRSNSKNPSTILQLIVTAIAYILHKYNGYVWMTRFNKLQIKYDTELIDNLNKKATKNKLNTNINTLRGSRRFRTMKNHVVVV